MHDVASTTSPAIDTSVSGLFNSQTLQQGDTFSYTFEKPGTYYHECTIHATMASMHAQVIVK